MSWRCRGARPRSTTWGQTKKIINDPNPNCGDIFASQHLAQTYVPLATKEPMLNAAVSALGLRRNWVASRDQVSASPVQGTQLMAVSVINTSPVSAKAIADKIARQMILLSPTTPSADEQAKPDFVRA